MLVHMHLCLYLYVHMCECLYACVCVLCVSCVFMWYVRRCMCVHACMFVCPCVHNYEQVIQKVDEDKFVLERKETRGDSISRGNSILMKW